MPLKIKQKFQFSILLPSILSSIIIAITIANHFFRVWHHSLPVQIIIIFFLAIIFSIAIYWTFSQFKALYADRVTSKKILISVLIALFLAVGVYWLLIGSELQVPTPPSMHTLEIISGATNNPISQGAEVVLLQIDIEGESKSLSVFKGSGDWAEEAKYGYPTSLSTNQTASLTYKFVCDPYQEVRLLFYSHPSGGNVEVRFDDQVKLIDLYEAGSGESLVIFRTQNPTWRMVLIVIDVLSLCVIFLLLELLGCITLRYLKKKYQPLMKDGFFSYCLRILPNGRFFLGVAFGVLAVLMIGFSRSLPVWTAKFIANTGIYSRTIDLSDYIIKVEGKYPHFYYSIDISKLGLISVADTISNPEKSPVILLENGKPLMAHVSLDDLKSGERGVFTHFHQNITTRYDSMNQWVWEDRLYFSPQTGGVSRKEYTLIVPASITDAYVLSQLTSSGELYKTVWIMAIILSLLSAWMINKYIRSHSALWYQLPLIMAVIVSYSLMTKVAILEVQPCRPNGTYSAWNVFCVAPDSSSYYFGYQAGSTRQPGYPLFIRLMGGRFDPNDLADKMPLGSYIDDESNPLMKVSRAQIMVLLGAGILLCFMTMRALRTPLAAIFFIFFYDSHYFIYYELNEIMTEPLTQMWLLLIVSCFIGYLWSGRKFLLPLAGILVAGSYLTRQASGYIGIFMGAMILWGLVKDWRATWKNVLLSLGIMVILVVAPDIYGLMKTKSSAFDNLTFQYRIVYALRVAKIEDVELMPDEESREWFAQAITSRDKKDADINQSCGTDIYCVYVSQIVSTYQAAITDDTKHLSVDSYLDVSSRIFKRRWTDYLRYGFDFWAMVINNQGVNRIHIGSLGAWPTYLLILVMALLIRGRTGYSSFMLVLAHWSHVMLCCLFAAPLMRMVWASDGLVYIALFLLGIETLQRGAKGLITLRTKWEAKQDKI